MTNKPEWAYCPECGCEDIRHEEGEHKQCANCHQEWFSSVDYSDVVRKHLSGKYIDKDAQIERLRDEVDVMRRGRDAALSKCSDLRAELGECKGEYDRAVNKVDALREALKTARDDLLAVAHLVPGDYIQKSVSSAEVVIAEQANKESAQ